MPQAGTSPALPRSEVALLLGSHAVAGQGGAVDDRRSCVHPLGSPSWWEPSRAQSRGSLGKALMGHPDGLSGFGALGKAAWPVQSQGANVGLVPVRQVSRMAKGAAAKQNGWMVSPGVEQRGQSARKAARTPVVQKQPAFWPACPGLWTRHEQQGHATGRGRGCMRVMAQGANTTS